MSRTVHALVVSLGACVVACLGASCEDASPPVPCVNAPPDGCPEDYGVDVCQDAACRAVYVCTDGKWVFARACAGRDASSDDGDAGIPTRDAHAIGDEPPIDAPAGAFGGSGCISLEAPDCPLGVALECTSRSDCCGCQDLFVCADGGWDPWGICADGGAVPR